MIRIAYAFIKFSCIFIKYSTQNDVDSRTKAVFLAGMIPLGDMIFFPSLFM